jgi:nitrate/nitrite-specific signal transduction histidine kinase
VPFRRIEDPARLRRLLEAVLLLESDLSLPVVLRHIVQAACSLVDARYGALGVLDEEGKGLAEFVNVGFDDDQVRAIGHLPEGHGILGLLILDPKPLRLADLTTHPESYGFPPGHPPMKSFLGVPVRVRDRVYGNLYLTEKIGGGPFTEEDEEAASGLAVAAGIAIENARLHTHVGELALLGDRDRIARDLHDTVIQRLFATGLSLEGTLRLIQPPDVAERVRQAVDDLDETIRQIRTTIFALETRGARAGLRDEVLALAEELTPTLGFHPEVTFEGLVDTLVPKATAEHLLATLRETLTNVARHARASRVWVRVAVRDDIVLEVGDDGRGISLEPAGTGRGLANMRRRAENMGGRLTIEARSGGGTLVRWQVPASAVESER